MVKEYTYLAGNILISIVCSKLYPDKFEFDGFIILSLALLFAGIYIYESFSEKNKAKKPKKEPQDKGAYWEKQRSKECIPPLPF